VFLRHGRLVPGLVASHFEVEVCVAREGYELSSLVGADLAHLFPAEHDGLVLYPRSHREDGCLHCTPTGCTPCFNSPPANRVPSDMVLDDRAEE